MKKIILFVLAAAVLLGTGAQAQHIRRELDANGCTITIDAPVHAPEVLRAETIDAAAWQWTEQQMLDLFFGGTLPEGAQFAYRGEIENVDGEMRLDGNIIIENIQNPRRKYMITHTGGGFDYVSPEFAYSDYEYISYFWDAPPAEPPVPDEAAEQAANVLRARLAELGMTGGNILDYFHFDEAYLAAHNLKNKSGCLIWLECTVNGTPILPNSFYAGGMEWPMLHRTACFQAYVSGSEVLYLSLMQSSCLPVPTGAPKPAEGPCLTLDEATEALQAYFEKLIMEQPVAVNQIRFGLAPIHKTNMEYKWTLRPVWCFYTDMDAVESKIIIDALTGKPIR